MNTIWVQVIPGPNWIPGSQTSINYDFKRSLFFSFSVTSTILVHFCYSVYTYAFLPLILGVSCLRSASLQANSNRLLLCLNLQAKKLSLFFLVNKIIGKITKKYFTLLKLGFFGSAILATEFKDTTSDSFFTHVCYHVHPLHTHTSHTKALPSAKIQPLTNRIVVLSEIRALSPNHHWVALERTEDYAFHLSS